MPINKEYVPIDNQPTIKPRTVTGIFTKYIAKTLPLAFDESMSYYECLCALLEYINTKVIPALDNNAEGLLELQEFYLELQNYVNDYFKNLDVQEEINNKLDDMVESGVLEQIIEQFLQSTAIWCFNNLQEMKEATNLTNGSFAKTLGYYSANDGGEALYKIRPVTNDDVVDEQYIIEVYDDLLVAELIINSPLDVRAIGIKGDGETTSNDFANGLKKHDSFIFKNGNYVIPQLTLENLTKYELQGVNATLSGTSSYIFNSCSNIKVYNLNFDSNTNVVFLFKDCQNVNVENNKFTNSTTATIRMQRTHGNICKNLKFLNNNFISVSKSNTWGGAIYVDGQGKNNSEDTTETLPIEQIEVKANLFEEVGTGGVNFGGVKDVIVDSNIFKNSYGEQNMLSTYSRESTNVVISNNTFSGCGWECCVINYSNNFNISGNYFEDFGYGIGIENTCENINASNNNLNGKKSSRTHTGGTSQQYTYGIVLSRANNISISNNNVNDCTYGIFQNLLISNVNINGNTIQNSTNAIGYGDTNGRTDNITFNNNVISSCGNGISIGSHGTVKICNNMINTTDWGIKENQFSSDTNVTIENNYIKSDYGIDASSIYNITCTQNILNNNIISTSDPLKKYAYDVNIGKIYWINPQIELNKNLIATRFRKGSIVRYNEANFESVPSGAAAAVGYYMAEVENGTVFIMSDGKWKRKTGGGGSSIITTSDM